MGHHQKVNETWGIAKDFPCDGLKVYPLISKRKLGWALKVSAFWAIKTKAHHFLVELSTGLQFAFEIEDIEGSAVTIETSIKSLEDFSRVLEIYLPLFSLLLLVRLSCPDWSPLRNPLMDPFPLLRVLNLLLPLDPLEPLNPHGPREPRDPLDPKAPFRNPFCIPGLPTLMPVWLPPFSSCPPTLPGP